MEFTLHENALFGAAQAEFAFDIPQVNILRNTHRRDVKCRLVAGTGTPAEQKADVQPQNPITYETVVIVFHCSSCAACHKKATCHTLKVYENGSCVKI
jgi:hypothetical protein